MGQTIRSSVRHGKFHGGDKKRITYSLTSEDKRTFQMNGPVQKQTEAQEED